MYFMDCKSRCTALPAIGLPSGSTTTTCTVKGLVAVATQSLRNPMSASDGRAVNDCESATERLETSVVCKSTRYDIGYGRSGATLTACELAPLWSTVPAACRTS